MITAELLHASPLFAALPATELTTIAERAADVRLEASEWLIREGEAAAFFVLLEGRLAVMKSVAGLDEQINTYVPGDFFGELPLLIGSPAVAGLQALQPRRVARLDGRDFRELIAQCDALSGGVMRAMAGRVEYLQQISTQATGPAVTVIGSRLDLA